MIRKYLILLFVLIALTGFASATEYSQTNTAVSDGTYTEFQLFIASNHTDGVNVSDGDLKYIYEVSSNFNARDSFVMDDFISSGVISRVYVRTLAKEVNDDFNISVFLRINGTDYYGDEAELTTSYSEVGLALFTENPDNSNPWTWEDIANLEAGTYVEHTGVGAGSARVTYIGLQVFYDNLDPNKPTSEIDNWGVYDTSPVELIANATDPDGDDLTYYFYGDQTDGSTFLGTSRNGSFNFSVSDGGTYYWKVRANDGTSVGQYSDIQNFIFLTEPTLISPTNASSINGTFPPLTNAVTFKWENNADTFHYQVAKDSNFNILAFDDYSNTNSTTLNLEESYYYWRVSAYNTTGVESNYSDVWEFDLNLTTSGITETAIDGIVYEQTDEGNVPVTESIVYIYNNTYSDQVVVGDNGYFLFTGLAASSTYSIQASKQGYIDSSIQLVTTVSGEAVSKNILIERRSGAGDQYDFHYVKYIVKDLLDTRYQNVDVEVFENGDVVPIFTTTTGTDGAATFILNRDQEYRLEFTNSTQDIDITVTHYPKDSEYNVYVDFSLQGFFDDDPKELEEITISASTSEINGTHAYINVTYIDALNETTGLKFTLKQTDLTDPINATTIDTAVLGNYSNVTHAFIVSDYEGQAYYIVITGDHTTFGDINRTIAVKFKGMLEDFGFAKVYLYLAVGLIIFGGSFFGALTSTKGSLILCIGTWVMIGMGWFDSLGSTVVSSISLATALATVMSFVAIFAKKDKEV